MPSYIPITSPSSHPFCLKRVFNLMVLVTFATLLCLSPSWTDEKIRPTHPWQLPLGTKIDIAYRVKTARVISFNRVALERDFPELRGQSDEVIKAWILDHFAFINSNQLRLNGIRNTPIDVDFEQIKFFYIPPGVGRGADVEVAGNMVSIKDCGNSSWSEKNLAQQISEATSSEAGLAQVRSKDHSNGLEPYYLAAAEYLRQLEIQDDYDFRNQNQNINYQTDESYFLMDYGFNLIYPDGEIRAFAYGRQSHFGRTANNRPHPDETYTDIGNFQETYTGSRIDFGGARTRSETQVSYHEAMKGISPDSVHEFIQEQLQRIGISTAWNASEPSGTSGPEHVTPSAMLTILSESYRRFEQPPYPGAIGRHSFDMQDYQWFIDFPQIARIKWTLFQMNESELRQTLDLLSTTNALDHLFLLSQHTFQMPLPEAAYAYALSKNRAIHGTALLAVSKVLDRFPGLVGPTIELALDALAKAGDSWPPDELDDLINVDEEFLGYEDFLMAVMQSRNHSAKNMVIDKVSSQPQRWERTKRLLDWLKENEKNEKVLQRAQFKFGPDLQAPQACEALMLPPTDQSESQRLSGLSFAR